jgi:hypothetical protein
MPNHSNEPDFSQLKALVDTNATSTRHRRALWIAINNSDIIPPYCWNFVQERWLVWMGRNTLYRVLEVHGWSWNGERWSKPIEWR